MQVVIWSRLILIVTARRLIDMLKIIGYDTSRSAYDLSVICEDCADSVGDGGGSPIYEGDIWGGITPKCSECNSELEGLECI